MKRVLVVGEHSYIGTTFSEYIKKHEPAMEVKRISARDEKWKAVDLAEFDCVLHVAGIAHADVGNVSEKVKQEYYKVNYELAVEVANAAKMAGVRQFIYLSSIIIYGESAPLGKQKVISKDTKPAPANFYGDSKLQADLAIQALNGGEFKTAVLRLPMVYGRGSRGNYPLLAKMAKKLPFFPNIRNERSMIYIENLCEFIKEIIEYGDSGVFYPQNSEYTVTAKMVECIADAADRSVHLSAILNPFIYLAGKMPGKIGQLSNKAFGNCVYEMKLSEYRDNIYQVCGFEESIRRTEGQ